MPLSFFNPSAAQDIIPDPDVTRELGSESLRWRDVFSQRGVFVGGDLAGNLIDTGAPATGPRGSVFGSIDQFAGSTAEIDIDQTGDTPPLLVGANIETTAAAHSARADVNTARGSALLADIRTLGAGASVGLAELGGEASALFGRAIGQAGGNGTIRNNGLSSFVFGYAHGNPGTALLAANAGEVGSFVSGSVNGYYVGYTAELSANASGQFVQGYCNAYQANTSLTGATGATGAFVQGYVNNYYGPSNIIAATGAIGAFVQGAAFGYGAGGAEIRASDRGAFAQGWAYTAGAGQSQILASARGAMARGYAYNGYNITASASGAMAVGFAYDGNIVASADNAVQFGIGSNSLADSVQIGNAGIRLKGTSGAPGVLQNGDIWRAGNFVYIRSNGISVQI